MVRLLLLSAWAAAAAEFPPGQIVDAVKCAADASQSYALYLPSTYSPDRAWPVILAFDPAARGRIPVERYRAAAEQFGYIVAGSNNSRNGSWAASIAAAQAMSDDVGTRFAIDAKRGYTAGMSGGARVAMGVALGSSQIAGVFASSAGFPDSKPRKTVPFAVFGTAGTEDFNLMEMRQLDRGLASPHRVAVFEGGHVWLSSELAVQAVEWMELEAMKSGRKPRDQALIGRIYARRSTAVAEQKTGRDTLLALYAMVADFDGFANVSAFATRAAELGRDKRVRDALKKDREEESREQREISEILAAENRLSSPDDVAAALVQLRGLWKRLSATAKGPADTADRRMARRILSGLALGGAERVTDPAYRAIINEFRPPRPGAR
jgi:poly(3-hydroxybutyrate) depolymerase